MALDPQVKNLLMMKEIKPALRKQAGEDFDAWQEKARAKLMELLGLPLEQGEENFRIEWTKDEDPACTEIRFLFESEPMADVSCHLLLPKSVPQENLPLELS